MSKIAMIDDATLARMVGEEDKATGRCELGFVAETRIKGGKIDPAWWQPPALGASGAENAYFARNALGTAYARQFVRYLQSNRDSCHDVTDDLSAIVEAMTGAKLRATERAFLRTISEAIADGPAAAGARQ
jgi:hypothetical protein